MTQRHIFTFTLATVIVGIAFSFWPPATQKNNKQPVGKLVKLGFQVTSGSAPGYIEDRACATCHQSIFESYQAVGMSQSFGRPEPKRYIEDFENNYFYHAKSQNHYEMIRRGDDLYFKRYQLDDKDKPINAYERKIDWILGSGHRARSYLYQTKAGEIYQFPIGWYTQTQSWRMSPGFDNKDHVGIGRLVRRECMFCHNAYPEVAEGSDIHSKLHLYPKTLPEGTGCQRCHGPGAEHVRLAFNGAKDLDQLRAAIINPGKLDPERRDDICFECHMLPSVALFGVRKFDRPTYSFRPGQDLSDYILNVDVEESHQKRSERFEINHHPYRLKQSACYMRSQGKLSCLSCHDPHRKVPVAERPAHYRKVCLQCHQAHEPRPVLNGPSKDAESNDCVACHMQQRRTQDVVQVVMTDHYIRRIPGGDDLVAPREEHKSILTNIQFLDANKSPKGDEGQIYQAVAVLRAGGNRSAVNYLEKSLKKHPGVSLTPWLDLIKAQIKLHQFTDVEANARRLLQSSPDNPLLLHWLGIAQSRLKKTTEALKNLRHAARIREDHPDIQYNLGFVLLSNKQTVEAIKHFQRATELRPTMVRAWFLLALAHANNKQYQRAADYYRHVLELHPRFTRAYRGLIKALLKLEQRDEALRFFRHGLKVAAQPEQIQDLNPRMSDWK